MVNERAHIKGQGSCIIKVMSMNAKTISNNDHTCFYSSSPSIVPTCRMKDSIICCTDTYLHSKACLSLCWYSVESVYQDCFQKGQGTTCATPKTPTTLTPYIYGHVHVLTPIFVQVYPM